MFSSDKINRQLAQDFGLHDDARPNWRVVWSEDQFEYRFGEYTNYSPGGIYLNTVKETRFVPRYRQWVQEKWVLEGLVPVPEVNELELPGVKLSYEPFWAFQDRDGNPLPPDFDMCKFAIEAIYAKVGKTGGVRYKDPDKNFEDARANRIESINEVEEELYGNETPVGDALARGSAVGYGGS